MEIVVPSPAAQLHLNRTEFSDKQTIGTLNIDNTFECYTLEDTVRAGSDGILQEEEKIFGETAIPVGIYRLVLAHSPKFGYCPWILNVPYFQDIRIHAGNNAADTHGCILVGRTKGTDWIGESRAALKALVEKLDKMDEHEDLWIEITGGRRAVEIGRNA